jgi:hypothetical protein
MSAQGATGIRGATGVTNLGTDPSFNSVTITGNNAGNANLVAPIRYGTDNPPSLPTGPYGTLYIQYVP